MLATRQHPADEGNLGSARVGSIGQSLDQRLVVLAVTGIPDARIYVDKKAGASVDRPVSTDLLGCARPGDRIVAHTLDRLGRNRWEVPNLVHPLREQDIGVKSLADPVPTDTTDEGLGRLSVLLLALFARMEHTFTTERAAHVCAVAEATGRRIDRPVAHADDKIEHARLLRREGRPLAQITKKTGTPKTSLRCYLGPAEAMPMATDPAFGDNIPAADKSTGNGRRADK